MKLGPNAILQLSLMICGEGNYSGIFPYRTSTQLTQFFYAINTGYAHDSNITRQKWVLGVLERLNVDVYYGDDKGNIDNCPSAYIVNVIKELLNPIYYKSRINDSCYNKAIDMMNSVLRPQGLSVYINSSNDVFVRPIKGEFVSTAVNPSEKRVISFCPEVFRVPDCEVNKNLVAVMMPFSEEFREVYNTIGLACSSVGMDCIRADDRGAWDNSEIIQDVFKLIFSSSIVVTDFSGKNENVYYEAGIAHTLGKLVIPIAQSKNDLPFDLEHHRAIIYYNNHEGRNELEIDLESRLQKLKERLQNKRSVMS